MKKLMLVGLLTALIGVPIGNALAAETLESLEPNNLGANGVYLYFPVVPSGFGGFDSNLFLSAFMGDVQLEVDTAGLVNLPGSPVQQTNVDIVQFSSAVLAPRPTASNQPNFQCVPAPNLCQLFIHHRVNASPILNFTATLLVTNGGSFQFIAAPWRFCLGPGC